MATSSSACNATTSSWLGISEAKVLPSESKSNTGTALKESTPSRLL